jgi:hypothetical protein
MRYSGAQGTLIYEKNLKSKISCQTPFNVLYTYEATVPGKKTDLFHMKSEI